jgi:hypothetical protein
MLQVCCNVNNRPDVLVLVADGRESGRWRTLPHRDVVNRRWLCDRKSAQITLLIDNQSSHDQRSTVTASPLTVTVSVLGKTFSLQVSALSARKWSKLDSCDLPSSTVTIVICRFNEEKKLALIQGLASLSDSVVVMKFNSPKNINNLEDHH